MTYNKAKTVLNQNDTHKVYKTFNKNYRFINHIKFGDIKMNNKNKGSEIREVVRKIQLVQLMIEKRKQRIAYYNQLINMGLLFSDRMNLEIFIFIKTKEIYDLLRQLDDLYTQKSLYEL